MTSGRLLSWGNFPPFPQAPSPCHWIHDLPAMLRDARSRSGTTLPFGSGLSYGDSCLAASDHVLALSNLDRFIEADWKEGLITVEAGATLEQILALAIPRGWFLPVTPGTKYITVGGAIANDVHGKNHHRSGTFGRHVKRFGLLRSDMPAMTCSAEENSRYFQATIGGLGLTGIIQWATIQLVPIQSSSIDCITQRFSCLSEFFQLSEELDHRHEFSVSWVDCLAKGKQLGRGVYMGGDFSPEGSLTVSTARRFKVPATPPFSLVNHLTLPLFNHAYWRRAPVNRQTKHVDYDPFFYPLDSLLQWNRMYGRNGFQQYQALIPEVDAEGGITVILNAIAESGMGSFLAVLKRCGDIPSPGLLSFPMPGTTIALDFPNKEAVCQNLFPRLDAIVRDAGGRLYPAKDAHMSGEDFRHSYPDWSRLESLRDPLLLSRFWQRVTQ